MLQKLAKNWWLLAICGILEAIISVIYCAMYDSGPDGSSLLSVNRWNGATVLLSKIAVMAGACTIATAIWSFASGKSWMLVLNGLAFTAYGLIPLLWRNSPLSFDVFAVLLIIMAMTFGLFAIAIARNPRRGVADEWFFGLAGAASVGFAFAFLALVMRWIQLERRAFHPSVFLWLCVYFGFSSICMLGMALRQQRLGPSHSGPWKAIPSLGNPKHAQ